MTKTKRKPRRKPKSKPLGTIWEVPDALWEKILPILRVFWPKKPRLVEGAGGPLGVVIAGANVLERRMLRATIEAIAVERPEPTAERPQHLSLDGGYENPTGREAASEAKSIPHIHSGSEVVKP